MPAPTLDGFRTLAVTVATAVLSLLALTVTGSVPGVEFLTVTKTSVVVLGVLIETFGQVAVRASEEIVQANRPVGFV